MILQTKHSQCPHYSLLTVYLCIPLIIQKEIIHFLSSILLQSPRSNAQEGRDTVNNYQQGATVPFQGPLMARLSLAKETLYKIQITVN